MNVFIWRSLHGITENYHSGGGAAVFAKTEERAREIIKEQTGKEEFSEKELEPDYTTLVPIDTEEQIFIFPDAGCC